MTVDTGTLAPPTTKRVILYTRVSTEEQARTGFSLAGQLDELREHAASNGLLVVEEIKDAGHSRGTLERPGIDRIRELAVGGRIDEVHAWKWDRFGESPYPEILQLELEPVGVTLRALDDEGSGEMADFLRVIRGGIAKMERKKTVERSRLGKLRRARQGEIIPTNTPTYGFTFSHDRKSYEVVEAEMKAVRLIFELVGARGKTLQATRRALRSEGIPAARGGKTWNQRSVKSIIQNDSYRPHNAADISALVAEGLMAREVAERLDPDKNYGIHFSNTRINTRTPEKVLKPDGSIVYRKRQSVKERPRKDWIAVPIPDAGVPLEHVESSRNAIKDNVRPSRAGDKVWELSGGIIRCGTCGSAMSTTRQHSSPGLPYLHYYRCMTGRNSGPEACSRRRSLRAEDVEQLVWEKLREAVQKDEWVKDRWSVAEEVMRNALIGTPPPESLDAFRERLNEIDGERKGYLRQNARNVLSDAELDELLHELSDERTAIETELKKAATFDEYVSEVEASLAFVREHIVEAGVWDFGIENPNTRQDLYRRISLTVTVNEDDSLDMTWIGGDYVCEPDSLHG